MEEKLTEEQYQANFKIALTTVINLAEKWKTHPRPIELKVALEEKIHDLFLFSLITKNQEQELIDEIYKY